MTRALGRREWLLALPVVALAVVWLLPEGTPVRWPYLGQEIAPLRMDALARAFATVFALAAFGGLLFAIRQASRLELAAAVFYAGAALGVVVAGDLITLVVWWELLALGSVAIVFAAGGTRSYRAGLRYLAIHLLGGVVLMAGVLLYVQQTGSADFGALTEAGIGRWLILAGFLLNAGAPPLSAWIADAYPESSPTGMVFLSAFTTKVAVYALIRGFPGEQVLIPLGLWMVFYGIVLALLENDMRRILAYSIVNQVGFMVVAVGIGTPLALNGATAHAFAHIIYKALLIMSAGAVLYRTDRRKVSDLGGLFRTMPLTTAFGTIGALSISSFPLTSGFTTKTMISEAAADERLLVLWLLLAAGSAGVFLHAGIKFPWFVFFQKDSGLRPLEAPLNMRYAMGLFAFLCIALGVFPEPLFGMLPHPVDYVPYTGEHVLSYLQLLLFAGLAFFALLPLMRRTLTITLDFDWLYRRLGADLTLALMRSSQGAGVALAGTGTRGRDQAMAWLERHGLEGRLSRNWPTGSIVLWISIILLAMLVVTNIRALL
ncbi:MAG: Na(+)/H(+) antiporter subunit D [Candidatus Limnocylindria bacterium]